MGMLLPDCQAHASCSGEVVSLLNTEKTLSLFLRTLNFVSSVMVVGPWGNARRLQNTTRTQTEHFLFEGGGGHLTLSSNKSKFIGKRMSRTIH